MKRLIPLPLLLLTSCSLVYDFDQFRPEEEIIPPDATDPSALSFDSVAPTFVLEGSGCTPIPPPPPTIPPTLALTGCTEDSVGVPIVISGGSIVADSVTVNGFGFVDQVVAATPSTDGTLLGFVLPIAVDTKLADGAEEMITVTATQGGVTRSIELTVRGLDEMTTADFRLTTEDPPGKIPESGGAVRFSTIILSPDPVEPVAQTLVLATTNPLHLIATADIRIDELITIDAVNLGGCAAGAPGFPGGCPPRGGDRPTTGGVGGGGGGNIVAGLPGEGGVAAGGMERQALMLSPLSGATGGGGGSGSANDILNIAATKAGGAGAGAIALTSGTSLVLSGKITANGLNGEQGTPCGLLGGSGGGGGGAGGAILLRAADQVLITGPESISVANGIGGTATDCKGGNGSPGLLRFDGLEISPLADQTPVRGAAWGQSDRIRTGAATQSFPLAGRAGTAYWLRTNNALDETPRSLAQDNDTVPVELQPGLNQLCAQVTEDGNLGVPESLNCINVAYIP